MDPYKAQMMIMSQISELSSALASHISSWLMALGLIITGLLVGAIAEYIWKWISNLIRWEKFSQWIGLSKVVHKIRPDVSTSVLGGQILFWVIFISFFMKGLETSGILWMSDFGLLYFEYLPNAVSALIILILTLLGARFVHWAITLLIDNPSSYLLGGISASLIVSLGAYGILITVGFDRYLSIALSTLLMAGHIIAAILLWLKGSEQGYFETLRISELE